MTIMEGFCWGVFGGVLAELLGFYKLAHATPINPMALARSFGYWFITFLMILAGGCLVIAYLRSNMALNAFLAMNVGASAPMIIASLVNITPHPEVRVN